MILQIRKSGGETCEACGATELLFQPSSNRDLEKELLGALKIEEPRWYRPVKRRWRRKVLSSLEGAAQELRDQTRKL